MRVFVAGASGAMGEPLIAELLTQGHSVVGMTTSEARAKMMESQGAEAAIADALDPVAVESALKRSKAEAVIDKLTSLPKEQNDMPKYAQGDAKLRRQGSGNLLQAAIRMGIRRYLQQSGGFFLKRRKGHTIHGGSAVGRPNGTIGFGHYAYQPETIRFVTDASATVARVKERSDLERSPGENLIRFSVLPWFDFTSVSHARNLTVRDSAPRITFGKITEAGGRCTMPLSIHVHHALADGSHVGQFVEEFERHLSEPELT